MSSVRTLALSAMMLVGFAGISAAQSATTPRQRADSGAYRRRAAGEVGRRGPGRDFFADLNLSAAQKAQIKTIRQKYQPQNQALRTQAKPYMDAAKAARQKGDTATARTNMEKARQIMEGGKSYRTQENADIRAILTADQQVKFDARQKEMSERGERGWKKGHSKPAK